MLEDFFADFDAAIPPGYRLELGVVASAPLPRLSRHPPDRPRLLDPGESPQVDAHARTRENVIVPIPTPVRSRAATSAAGVLTRVGPRTPLACVCALVLLTVAGCGPDRGLRIEPASTASPTLLNQSNEDAGPPDKPFSLETIRTAIEDASGVAVTGRAAETAEVVGECTDCLKFGAPFTRGEEKFQVVTVANPRAAQ